MTDPAWIHLGIEAAKLAMADRDAHLTDPGFRDVPVAQLTDPGYAAALAARIDPRRAARPVAATNPSGGGTVYLAAVDGDGNAVSLIQSQLLELRVGRARPGHAASSSRTGAATSASTTTIPTSSSRASAPLHTLLPGMLFRDGVPSPWVVAGAAGGDAQPQIHAQLVSALVDGAVDLRTAISAPRWFVEPAAHFEPPVEVRLEPRFTRRVSARRSRRSATRSRSRSRSTRPSARSTRSSSSAADPASPDGSLAAATDPRSDGLPAVW